MKILYAIPDGIDLGGIITVTEQYLIGLRELGHEVHFARVTFHLRRGLTKTPKRKGYTEDQWSTGQGTWQPVHPVLGWAGKNYPIGASGVIEEFLELSNSCDGVIWGCLYGFNCPQGVENPRWMELITKTTVPQIAILHDDHFRERQLWSLALEPWIRAWACVHQCSFDLVKGAHGPRALIFNAHETESVLRTPVPASHIARKHAVLSVQTAKPWKKVDKFLLAVPHLMETGAWLAGDGIELRYMRSEEKCKPAYFTTKRNDPDAGENLLDYRIWDNAIECSHFKYIGPVSEARRNQLLLQVSLLADFSTRSNTGQFNRVFVEALRMNTMTIANPNFMSGVNRESESFLKEGVHYHGVDPVRDTPKEMAAKIEAASMCSARTYRNMMEAGRELLTLFDRKFIAGQLLELLDGAPTGYLYGEAEPDKELCQKGRDQFLSIFGTDP